MPTFNIPLPQCCRFQSNRLFSLLFLPRHPTILSLITAFHNPPFLCNPLHRIAMQAHHKHTCNAVQLLLLLQQHPCPFRARLLSCSMANMTFLQPIRLSACSTASFPASTRLVAPTVGTGSDYGSSRPRSELPHAGLIPPLLPLSVPSVAEVWAISRDGTFTQPRCP